MFLPSVQNMKHHALETVGQVMIVILISVGIRYFMPKFYYFIHILKQDLSAFTLIFLRIGIAIVEQKWLVFNNINMLCRISLF